MSEREKELEKLIIKYKKAYYEGEAIITDTSYDLLEDELRILNANNPSLHLVGTPRSGKVTHNPPMLSCKKATNIEEVVKWLNDSNGADLFFGYKIDGLSLSLVYEDGKLIQAATRGNGISGDDVTFGVIYIPNVPKTIPDKRKINIRGEVFMKISEFNRLKKKLPEISSPRNFASGTLKQKNPEILLERELSFMAWGLEGFGDNHSLDTLMNTLLEWKFETADIKLLENVDRETIKNEFDEVVKDRDKLDMELDGVVFKYNKAEDRKKAGSTEHHPKWQIALKFKSQGGITKVNKITWQVGRTGVLTPVAELEPIRIAGAKISRATLHNADFIEGLGLSVGDEVYLERSGDVIPKIIEVVKSGNNNVELNVDCPSCNSKAIREGVNLLCVSLFCKSRDLRSIEYFVNTVEIKGLGPKYLDTLFDLGLVMHYADLYSEQLTLEKLEESLGANGKKIYANIEKSRNIKFSTFLAALGIPQLGKALGKELSKQFASFTKLRNTTVEELIEIEGISDLTAQYILKGINDESITDRILMNNINILYDDMSIQDKGSSLGKVYVTGSVEGINKKEIEDLVVSMGFEWSKSVSRKLKYLVTGINYGQSKLDKALIAEVDILTWNEFMKKHGKK